MLESLFYFIIVIGVLVFFHELGHFMAAKAFGMRVDVFSLGMGPRAIGFQRGDTDYRLSWFPLGGYVKIAGMIDESLDTDFVASEPQSWEYRSKPRWQRMIVISAGVIMNVIIAGIIFSFLNFSNGKQLIPFDANRTVFVEENSLAWEIGIRTGDRLVRINDQEIRYWNDLLSLEEISAVDLNFTVLRDGRSLTLHAPDNFQTNLGKKDFGITYPYEPVIGTIAPGSAAEKSDLQPGDRIVKINDRVIERFEDIPAYLGTLEDPNVLLTLERDRRELVQPVTLQGGKIGITPQPPVFEKVEYSSGEAITSGFAQTITGMGAMINSFTRIFQGKEDAREAIGGPIQIFRMSGQMGSMGIDTFLNFIAMLSLSLALLNILPIPALDGGHLVILMLESVVRRDIPNKIKIGIQQTGLYLLIGLLAFTIVNDITRIFL